MLSLLLRSVMTLALVCTVLYVFFFWIMSPYGGINPMLIDSYFECHMDHNLAACDYWEENR